MKQSKILVMILVLAMTAVMLFGCAPAAPAASSAAPAASSAAVSSSAPAAADDFASKKFTIGLSQEGLDHPFMIGQRKQIVDTAAAEYPNIKVICTDGQGNVAKQVAGIEDMMSQGINLLIVQAAKAEGLKEELEKVHQANIPFMFAGKPIRDTAATTIVSNDNLAIGKQVGQFIVDQLKAKFGEPKGNVLIIEGIPGDQTSEDRIGGAKSVLKDFPNIKIGAQIAADYRRQKAYTVTQDMLTKFATKGSIDVIYGCNGDSALGAVQAIADANRTDEKIIVLSVDGTQEELDKIKTGEITAAWLYKHCGKEAFETAVKILKGEKVDAELIQPSVCVTKDNVEGMAPAF